MCVGGEGFGEKCKMYLKLYNFAKREREKGHRTAPIQKGSEENENIILLNARKENENAV